MDPPQQCQHWLPKKSRFCSGHSLPGSRFCGNHNPHSAGKRVSCPVDPSHTVLEAAVAEHIEKCPFVKLVKAQSSQPYYKKGIHSGNAEDDIFSYTCLSKGFEKCSLLINGGIPVDNTKGTVVGGGDEDETKNLFSMDGDISSSTKRKIVSTMSENEIIALLEKIELAHKEFCENQIQDSYLLPASCSKWLSSDIDRRIPFQEKHIMQNASMLGNLELMGIIKGSKCVSQDDKQNRDHNKRAKEVDKNHSKGRLKVVEFGAGRGYLTHMISDCYDIKDIVLVERRSYKFKADRTLRQKEDVHLERLRIDIQDFNLEGVKSLEGCPYVSVAKHLCGQATDLALRCSVNSKNFRKCDQQEDALESHPYLQGLAFATCCHHLCQWRSYVNKQFFIDLGFSRKEFLAITWLTSWAIDGEHAAESLHIDPKNKLNRTQTEKFTSGTEGDAITQLKSRERSGLGIKCKELLDVGRLSWLRTLGLNAKLVSYVPCKISPENKMLIARNDSSLCLNTW